MVREIIEVCVIPLLGILTKYLIDFLSAKRVEIKHKADNELAKKYTDMIYDTITSCVIATNQTYTESLKQSGDFDVESQKQAFQKTMEAVLAVLTEDAKDYISSTTGDLNVYLTQLIEKEVNKNKKEAINK